MPGIDAYKKQENQRRTLFELAAIFGGSFTLALSGILTTGPILSVTIAESARRGFKAGPLIISGHAFPELILVLAIIWGWGLT